MIDCVNAHTATPYGGPGHCCRRRAMGAHCTTTIAGSCADGLACDFTSGSSPEMICFAPSAADAICTAAGCAAGLYCNLDRGDVCPPSPRDSAVRSTPILRDGLACIGGTCSTLLPDGATCGSYDVCLSGAATSPRRRTPRSVHSIVRARLKAFPAGFDSLRLLRDDDIIHALTSFALRYLRFGLRCHPPPPGGGTLSIRGGFPSFPSAGFASTGGGGGRAGRRPRSRATAPPRRARTRRRSPASCRSLDAASLRATSRGSPCCLDSAARSTTSAFELPRELPLGARSHRPSPCVHRAARAHRQRRRAQVTSTLPRTTTGSSTTANPLKRVPSQSASLLPHDRVLHVRITLASFRFLYCPPRSYRSSPRRHRPRRRHRPTPPSRSSSAGCTRARRRALSSGDCSTAPRARRPA